MQLPPPSNLSIACSLIKESIALRFVGTEHTEPFYQVTAILCRANRPFKSKMTFAQEKHTMFLMLLYNFFTVVEERNEVSSLSLSHPFLYL